MIYLLDTDAAVEIIRDRRPHVRERCQAALEVGHSLVISTITVYELWYGVHNSSNRAKNIGLLTKFLAGRIETVEFDDRTAEIAGQIRATLRSHGNIIGPYDLLIAAHAKSLQATLVTGNVDEFSRVEGLAIEDWTQEA